MGNASARHQSRPVSPLTLGTLVSITLGELGIQCLNKSSVLRRIPDETPMEISSSNSFLYFQAKEERNLLSLMVAVLPPPLYALTLGLSN